MSIKQKEVNFFCSFATRVSLLCSLCIAYTLTRFSSNVCHLALVCMRRFHVPMCSPYTVCVYAFFLFSERFEHTQRFFLVFGKSQTKSLHKHYRHTSPLYIPKIYDTHGGTKMLCREMESPLSIIRFVKIWKRFLFYFAVISNRHTRWKTQSYTTGPCIWQWQCHFWCIYSILYAYTQRTANPTAY